MKNIIADVRRSLTDNIDENTVKTTQNFFKEKINFYGVKIPIVNKISKASFDSMEDRSKNTVFALCEELWRSGYTEESYIACNWSYYIRKEYEPDDMRTFKHWVDNYVNNWASCDTLCNHSVGTLIEVYPECVVDLKKWTDSRNKWMKRAAAVSLIIPARKGLFLNELFDIADVLMPDEEDLVQKGYGWMLKAASEAHRQEVFDFVMSRKTCMKRTALRYAIEKMPEDMKERAMAK